MWPAICKQLLIVGASFFSGIAIKIMDDVIDEEYDAVIAQPNLATLYGRGVVAYGLLALAIAVSFHMATALSLFFGAYAVGMGFSKTSVYPSKLTGFAESALVSGLSAVIVGVPLTLVAICLMSAVQLWDNWFDEFRQGMLPFVLGLALVAIGVLVDYSFVAGVLFAYALFFTLERWWVRRLK